MSATGRSLAAETGNAPKPFLKWVGGKRQLLPELRKHIPATFGAYYEPFIGGGALFFDLCATNRLRAHLGDRNARLIRTYLGVRDHVEDVIEGLKRKRYSKEEYYRTRAEDVTHASDVDTAIWFIYLNRCGFNGLYRVNSSGGFNVPIGRYDNPTICDADGLRAASRALAWARSISLGDFEDNVESAASADLVYFDPPYVSMTATANFTSYTSDGFSPVDQTRLRDCALQLKQRGVHVILSNSDTPPVRELYREPVFRVREVSARRNVNSKASKRGAVGELIIT